MTTEHVPNLITLNQTPSWLNANGKIDRSACCEITIAEVRRRAGCVRHAYPRPDHAPQRLPTRSLPAEKAARNQHGRVATGVYRLTADDLLTVLSRRLPRYLGGDWRTVRANAMRPRWFDPDKPFHFRAGRKDVEAITPFDAGLDDNPNKGASRSKVIGIWETWYQPVRLEKWQFPTRKLPGYFLVCPGHALAAQLQSLERAIDRSSPRRRKKIEEHLMKVRQWMLARFRDEEELADPPGMDHDPRLPPLSTRPAGREDPKSRRCPQRTYKLMMPLCTEAEFRDACIAQSWIDAIPARLIPQHRAMIETLRARYGLLFQPRVLLCPRCLGVRYGNNPENARQSWRRLSGKPDARPAKRIVEKSNNWKWAQEKTKRRRKR